MIITIVIIIIWRVIINTIVIIKKVLICTVANEHSNDIQNHTDVFSNLLRIWSMYSWSLLKQQVARFYSYCYFGRRQKDSDTGLTALATVCSITSTRTNGGRGHSVVPKPLALPLGRRSFGWPGSVAGAGHPPLLTPPPRCVPHLLCALPPYTSPHQTAAAQPSDSHHRPAHAISVMKDDYMWWF